MGSELVTVSFPLFSQIFEHHFPHYLALGMTYEQYYLGDPWLVDAYRKAQVIKNRMRNQELWLQGRYIYDAVCAISPILHAFAKRGTKPLPYNENVYPLTKEEAEQIRLEKEQKEFEIMKARLSAWSAVMNAKLKKGDQS